MSPTDVGHLTNYRLPKTTDRHCIVRTGKTRVWVSICNYGYKLVALFHSVHQDNA